MNGSSTSGDWVGRVIDGRYPLLERLGSSGDSSVFLTEFGEPPQKATIKIIPADAQGTETHLPSWEAAQKLAHPNLMQVFSSGSFEIDSEPMLYVISEFADEVLAEILPQRALSAEETREMLAPALHALSYLHEKGFVHGRLRPSNIMATGDKLKLSTDELAPLGAAARPAVQRTVYDAPETAAGPMTSAADVWSLGATIVEVLTQHPLAWSGADAAEPIIADSVPQPFAVIARECLHIDPVRRCTLEQIKRRLGLEPSTVAEAEPDRAEVSRRRVAVSIGAAGIVLATIGIWMAFELHHEPASSPVAEVQSATAEPAAVTPAAEPRAESPAVETEQAPASPEPSASVPPAAKTAPGAVPAEPAPTASPAPGESSSPALAEALPSVAKAHAPAGGEGKGEVEDQVQPDVLASAMKTISGSVKVAVRVSVDASGRVTSADFDSAGPSKYFANKALEAARHWTFKPAQVSGQAVASTWILHFDFRREGIQMSSSETAP